MTKPKPPPAAPPAHPFTPVPVRPRHDGWSVEKQTEFIETLAECGCVVDACRRVGMSTESAYALRRRITAWDFRRAWDAALDYAINRLSDAACSRAIHGVAVPHFYKGEQIGEHRRYDEALTRFLLRYRDPLRYAKSRDALEFEGDPEYPPMQLERQLAKVADNHSVRTGLAYFARREAKAARKAASKAERQAARAAAAAAAAEMPAPPPDVPSTSSTSAVESAGLDARWPPDAGTWRRPAVSVL